MANTVSRRSVVYDILFEIESGKKSAKEAEKALKDVEKTAGGVEGQIKSLGKAFIGAFAVQEVVKRVAQFATEAVNLARQAEGVRRAFNNLNDPNILNELRKATRGTVGDLQLMQAAVRAQNFKIPLQQLGTYFDFARQRARDTGQSVDYLVNSIIDGIGRKSTLVLDNLGLSAAEIQQEFAKTGDLATAVGNIIQREMGDSAISTDGAADSIDRYNASIENLKTVIGEKLLPIIGELAEGLNNVIKNPDVLLPGIGVINEFNRQTEEGLRKFEDASRKAAREFDDFAERFTEAMLGFKKEAPSAFDELNKKVVLFGANLKDVFSGKQDVNIKLLVDQLSELKKELTETDLPIDKARQLQKQIELLDKALKSLFGEGKEVPAFEKNFANPLTELNKFIDESQAKTDKLKKDLEELLKIKVEAPEEEKPKDEEDQLKRINAQLQQEVYIREQLNSVIGTTGEVLGTLAGLAKQGSELQMALAISAILINQARSISAAIAAGSEFGITTGPAALVATPAAIATLVGGVIATFAQVFSVINQAKAAQSKAVAFAEGEVDIHRPGEVRGKDSIPAVIMPGESVITTGKTSKYKPFLRAIHEGTLEDLIRVNYVEPALAISAMEQAEKDSAIDYSPQWYRQYRTMIEGHSLNKQAIGQLRQINKNLSRRNGGWYV